MYSLIQPTVRAEKLHTDLAVTDAEHEDADFHTFMGCYLYVVIV